MKPIKGTYNIVIAGSWNPSIFNPLWLNKNLLKKDEGKQVEIAYPINDFNLPMQISIPNLKIYPSTQRLEIKLDNENYSDLESAINLTKKIASLLQHTPVNGIGFNFSFEESNDIAFIPSKFDFQDNANIDATTFKLKLTTIKRTYELDNKQNLNLTILYNNDFVRIEFNYHYDISDMCEVITILDEKNAIDRLSQPLDFLKKVYDIQIDENNQDS